MAFISAAAAHIIPTAAAAVAKTLAAIETKITLALASAE